MVGQRTVTKPSRSDEVLDAEDQLRVTNQIKAHFDAIAPKRPLKPNRSEADDNDQINQKLSVDDQHIPEVDKLRSLQSQSSHVILGGAEGDALLHDEFVETQYYKELTSIDKQHHTTGTGFIKAVQEGRGGDGYNIDMLQRNQDGLSNRNNGADCKSFRSNPATNDWIPSVEDDQVMI